MKTTMTLQLRRFTVRIRDERTGEESIDTIVFDKRKLQQAQEIGISSEDLIYKEYNRRGYFVLEAGGSKAEKQIVELDLEALFAERTALCKECGAC